jgi:hypothetical protein
MLSPMTSISEEDLSFWSYLIRVLAAAQDKTHIVSANPTNQKKIEQI